MKKIFLALVVSVIGVLFSAVPVSAAGSSFVVKTSVEVSDTYKSKVSTVVEITGAKSLANNLDFPVLGANVTGLNVRTSDNGKIDASIQNGRLKILTAPLSALGDKASMLITYTSDVGARFGDNFLFFISPSDYGSLDVKSESISVGTSLKLGAPSVRGIKPTSKSLGIGNERFSWSSDKGAIGGPVGLLFGDKSVARLSLNKTLQNDSLWWKTMEITLPPDTNQQKVRIEQLSPSPKSVRLDEDGDVIVSYSVGPRQKLSVNAQVLVELHSYEYSLDSEQSVNDVEQHLKDRYLGLNDKWSDGGFEMEVNANSTSVVEIIEGAYRYVSKEFKDVEGIQDKYEASRFRANKLVGELRANGVPARLVLGASFGDGQSLMTTATSHAWAEAYVPGAGWVTLDPSFEAYGDYFGRTDMQRIAMVLRGDNPDYPPEIISDFSISFASEEFSMDPAQPNLSSTKYMFFPGVSLEIINVSMNAGTILDYTGVQTENKLVALGSLAPFQSVSIRGFEILGDSFKSDLNRFGIFEDGVFENGQVLGEFSSKTSYMPMLVIVLLIGLFYFMKWMIHKIQDRRKGNRLSTVRSPENSGIDSSMIHGDLTDEQTELDEPILEDENGGIVNDQVAVFKPKVENSPSPLLTDESREEPKKSPQVIRPNTLGRSAQRRITRPPVQRKPNKGRLIQ